jgi:protein-tyrosine kinase
MGVLRKIISKFRSDTSPAVDQPKLSNRESLQKKSADTQKTPGRYDEIDIPLNQDLSEFENHEIQSAIKTDKLDFDFTNLGGEEGEYAETMKLDFNPFKAFSNQLNLNLDKISSAGFISPSEANTPLSNSFRMIKRPLLNISQGKGEVKPNRANCIMLSSSVSGEGKSYCAINLALSIAMERDKRVLLIDADVNKPSHHETFGTGVKLGLTDLLLGNVKDMSEVIYKTDVDSLSLMFTGTQISHATELLASEAMQNFIDEISARYSDRIIIFDSPPLLLTTEASVLASHMGQIVLVIEAEKTLSPQVNKSLSLLSNDVVLLLLNKMREKGDNGNYGYYGYGQNP